MKVTAVELSGRSHEIHDLQPEFTVKILHEKVEQMMPPGCGKFCLVLESEIQPRILDIRDYGKTLQEVGIKDGAAIPVAQVSGQEIFEFVGEIGDEERNGAYSESIVRMTFTSDLNCLLIRQTHYRSLTGSFVWDICRGTYEMEGDEAVECKWESCFRRRRGGVERNGHFSIHDSGWTRKHKVPEAFKRVLLKGDTWKRRKAAFQEDQSILDIRLSGRNNCAEAIALMAL